MLPFDELLIICNHAHAKVLAAAQSYCLKLKYCTHTLLLQLQAKAW